MALNFIFICSMGVSTTSKWTWATIRRHSFSDHENVDTNVFVVSNGAEVIIISAPFYRDNMNEKCSAVLTLKLETILKNDFVNEMRIKGVTVE